MTRDIVQELRRIVDEAHQDWDDQKVIAAAADELERLRAIEERIRMHLGGGEP